jgi:hypothetical protein
LPKNTARAKATKSKGSASSIDVKELLTLLQGDPRARRSVSVILALKELGDKLSYPIGSYDDLVKKMSAKPFMINEFIDRKKLKSVVPKYYFPIATKKDFMEKVQELYRFSGKAASLAPTLPLPPPSPESKTPTLPLPPPSSDESPTIPLPPPSAIAWGTRRMASPLRRFTTLEPSEAR